jgi:hypothetical protein
MTFLEWLEAHPLLGALREHFLLAVVVRVLHVLGLAALFGAVLVWDARLLGAARSLPLEALARLTLPIALAGFGLALPSGLLLFCLNPLELSSNPAFLFKLLALALALLNAALFWRLRLEVRPFLARVSASVSLLLWSGVLVLGRLIGYV